MGLQQENCELRMALECYNEKIVDQPPSRKSKCTKEREHKAKTPEPCPKPEKDSMLEIPPTPKSEHKGKTSEPCPQPGGKNYAKPSDSHPQPDKDSMLDVSAESSDESGAEPSEPSPKPGTKCDTKPSHSSPQPDPQKMTHCHRIFGEMAFRLDRKILCAVFPNKRRLYGYRVANLKEKIIQVTTCQLTGKVDERLRSELNKRYCDIVGQLKKLGYDQNVHPYFTEHLVNTYGILKERAAAEAPEMNDLEHLRKMIAKTMHNEKSEDMEIILNCLAYLSKQEGSTILTW
ncbi:speriolin-like isoform X1 [Eleutherodactylus coqui]|uniref:speriolin-like isoform X1 n=1 Tax=Eleutherodactylus coqui TaxID=57060 RepID=UPI0034622511